MNGAPRKRYYGGSSENLKVSHSDLHKKSRPLMSPQTSSHVSMLVKSQMRERHHEVTHVESDEVELEEEVEDEAQGQEIDEDEESAMPLVVFQCSTCRSIFGDSYAFVCSTEQLWLVTLSHVTNVILAPDVQTASVGLDAGSSYHELLCQNCQAVLGRRYLTTPVVLDNIRDLFSFSTEAITSYTLGDPMQKGETGADEWMKQAATACSTVIHQLAAERSEVLRLREEMEKVKTLMVALDDRLAHVEGASEDDATATTRQRSRKSQA